MDILYIRTFCGIESSNKKYFFKWGTFKFNLRVVYITSKHYFSTLTYISRKSQQKFTIYPVIY